MKRLPFITDVTFTPAAEAGAFQILPRDESLLQPVEPALSRPKPAKRLAAGFIHQHFVQPAIEMLYGLIKL
jgi:hypothetical protein